VGNNYGSKSRIMSQIWQVGLMICLAGSYFAFLVLQGQQSVNALGWTAIILLVMFYTSPMMTFMEVIRTKNASSFTYSLSVTCGINSMVWTVYGTLKQDPYIWAPNLVGLFVAVVQLVCKCIYSSNNTSAQFQPV
jgi:solute carrier family 50 (sugar transporter)